jgi:hypothetical protein
MGAVVARGETNLGEIFVKKTFSLSSEGAGDAGDASPAACLKI